MKNYILFIFLLSVCIFTGSGLYGICPNDSESAPINVIQQDSLEGNQVLYNGIMWRNRYYKIREDQFLFSKEFLTGSLSINGQSFNNLSIRYDIYNDEIMIHTNHGAILQLNKEMVDSFTVIFNDETFRFNKIPDDTLKGFKGYVNVLYKGNTALFVKYKKEIDLLAVENKFDIFYQTHRIYFMKDNILYPIASKHYFLKILKEDKQQVRSFIKKNKLKVSKNVPASFVPVIRFYDNLRQ